MSTDDDTALERLIDAARDDITSDEKARQARLYDDVLRRAGGQGPDGGGAPTALHPVRSWRPGLTVAVGIATIAGLASFVFHRSSSQSAAAPAVLPPVALAAPSLTATQPLARTATLGTSVWDLPSQAAASSSVGAQVPREDADEFGRELAALAAARSKLRERDLARALALLDEFDRRFPHARIRDEASVLRVEVLFALGREEDAKRLGNEFAARHPDSLYLPRVMQLIHRSSRHLDGGSQ